MAKDVKVYPAGKPIEGQWGVSWHANTGEGPFFWYYPTEVEARKVAEGLTDPPKLYPETAKGKRLEADAMLERASFYVRKARMLIAAAAEQEAVQ